jgi:SAM-dependent methyltransferase
MGDDEEVVKDWTFVSLPRPLFTSFWLSEGCPRQRRGHRGREPPEGLTERGPTGSVAAMLLVLQIAKNALRAFPPVRRAALQWRLARGYDASKDETAYARSVYKRHSVATGIRGRILEIGPGGNVAVAALYVKNGADSAVCIDSTPWNKQQEYLYRDLEVEDVLDRVEYLSPVNIENCKLPDESFDVIYSHASFEHFSDPAAAIRNIVRMLKAGGITSHQIDFRDHRDFSKPLEFLKLGNFGWWLVSSSALMGTNRWRANEIEQGFVDQGLRVVFADAGTKMTVTEEMRRSFAPKFRRMSLDTLGVIGLHLVMEKPRM